MNIIAILIQVGGLEVFVRGLIFLSNILLARGLGPEEFSIFVFVWSLVQGLWLLTESGTTVSGIREVAKGKRESLVLYGEFGSIRLLHALVIEIAFFLVLCYLPWDEHKKTMAFLCSTYIVFYSPYADWVARGLENVNWLALGRASYGIVCLFIAFLVFSFSVNWLAFLMFPIAAFIGSAVMLLRSKGIVSTKALKPFKVSAYWWKTVSKSWVYTIGGIITIAVQYIPIWWLDSHAYAKDLKIFTPAFSLLFVLSNVLSIVSLVFIPRLTKYMHTDDKNPLVLSRGYFYVSILISAFSVWVFYSFPGLIISVFYGKSYLPSSETLHLLSPLAMLFALQYAVGSFITASGKQWMYCIALSAALIVQMVILAFFSFSDMHVITASIVSIGGIMTLIAGLGIFAYRIAIPFRRIGID